MQAAIFVFSAILPVIIMSASVHAQPGVTDVTPENAEELDTLLDVSIKPRTDGSGRLRLVVSGRAPAAVSVSANLILGSIRSPKLQATLPVNVRQTQDATEDMRSWYIEAHATPDTATEIILEVFINPTDKPTGNGRLYRVIIKEFLKDDER